MNSLGSLTTSEHCMCVCFINFSMEARKENWYFNIIDIRVMCGGVQYIYGGIQYILKLNVLPFPTYSHQKVPLRGKLKVKLSLKQCLSERK